MTCGAILESAANWALAIQGGKYCAPVSKSSLNYHFEAKFLREATIAKVSELSELVHRGAVEEIGWGSGSLSEALCTYYKRWDVLFFKKLKGKYLTGKSDLVEILKGLVKTVKVCNLGVVVDDNEDTSNGFATITGYANGPLCQDRCRLHQIINGGDLEHRNEAFVRV